jgi:hypothetical protein
MNRGTSVPASTCQTEQNRTILPFGVLVRGDLLRGDDRTIGVWNCHFEDCSPDSHLRIRRRVEPANKRPYQRRAGRKPLFSYLAPSESADEKMVTLTFASWNQIAGWLGRLAALRTLREAA